MKHLLYYLLMTFLSVTSFGQNGRITITNNCSFDINVVVEGNDIGAFLPTNNYIESNMFTVNTGSSWTLDPCIIQTFCGWNYVPGAGYTCSPPATPYTVIWRDVRVSLPSIATCGAITGGSSAPSCGLLGFTSPYSFCTGGEYTTWFSALGCVGGADVVITVNP